MREYKFGPITIQLRRLKEHYFEYGSLGPRFSLTYGSKTIGTEIPPSLIGQFLAPPTWRRERAYLEK